MGGGDAHERTVRFDGDAVLLAEREEGRLFGVYVGVEQDLIV